jgi:hypothetical protein
MPSNLQKSVALTTTAQSLYSLLATAYSPQEIGRSCARFEVWGDDTLTTGPVYCGDSLVSSTNHAYVINTAGDRWSDDSPNTNSIALTQYYLRASAATPSVNVRITYY